MPATVLRFLDGDGDPVYVDADLIVGITIGLADRRDPETGHLVRVRGTILHTAAGPIPVDDDYERVLALWLAATGSDVVEQLDDIGASVRARLVRLPEPAPCE